jgi:hypothetical protein
MHRFPCHGIPVAAEVDLKQVLSDKRMLVMFKIYWVIFELPSTLLLLMQHHHGSSTIFHTLLPSLPDLEDSEP